MKIVSGSEMAEIDRRSIQEFGIPGQTLMESAGRATVASIARRFPQVHRLAVFCGPGNNGGDGMVVARCWHDRGRPATVWLSADDEAYRGDAATNLKRLRQSGIEVRKMESRPVLDAYDAVVDALFGTGLKRDVEGSIADLIEYLNGLSLPRVAVDIPSGVDSGNGKILGCAIRANLTVTFGLPKLGHWMQPGRARCGLLRVAEIGFPRQVLQSASLLGELLGPKIAHRWLPDRPPEAHKGTSGRVLLAVGSQRYPGAAVLATRAALRMGAGMVYVAVPAAIANLILVHNPEAMVLPTPSHPDRWEEGDVPWLAEQLKEKHSLAVGSGCGDDPATLAAIRGILKLPELPPAVVDADAIVCARDGVASNAVLTPHHGELGRLLGVSTAAVGEDRLGCAQQAARQFQCVVLLKGNPTLVVQPDGRFFVNSSGGPLLAQGGSGDVLTGAIAALLAQRLPPARAAGLGAYVHGRSADVQVPAFGDRGLLAREIADGLVGAVRQVRSGKARK